MDDRLKAVLAVHSGNAQVLTVYPNASHNPTDYKLGVYVGLGTNYGALSMSEATKLRDTLNNILSGFEARVQQEKEEFAAKREERLLAARLDRNGALAALADGKTIIGWESRSDPAQALRYWNNKLGHTHVQCGPKDAGDLASQGPASQNPVDNYWLALPLPE